MNLYITGREGKGRARGRVGGRGEVKVQCKGRGRLRIVGFDGDGGRLVRDVFTGGER